MFSKLFFFSVTLIDDLLDIIDSLFVSIYKDFVIGVVALTLFSLLVTIG